MAAGACRRLRSYVCGSRNTRTLAYMGKVELQNQIRSRATEASAIGACLFVECPDGGFDLIEAETVQLCGEYVEAHDLGGTKVQIPYTMIAGVTVDLL
jgi:hypothetical protein